nr:pyruvate kinase [Kocuria turfanensis]
MRRAKIVATIGPAISSYENLSRAIRSGMNVARLNMSHGDHSVHDSGPPHV